MKLLINYHSFNFSGIVLQIKQIYNIRVRKKTKFGTYNSVSGFVNQKCESFCRGGKETSGGRKADHFQLRKVFQSRNSKGRLREEQKERIQGESFQGDEKEAAQWNICGNSGLHP